MVRGKEHRLNHVPVCNDNFAPVEALLQGIALEDEYKWQHGHAASCTGTAMPCAHQLLFGHEQDGCVGLQVYTRAAPHSFESPGSDINFEVDFGWLMLQAAQLSLSDLTVMSFSSASPRPIKYSTISAAGLHAIWRCRIWI